MKFFVNIFAHMGPLENHAVLQKLTLRKKTQNNVAMFLQQYFISTLPPRNSSESKKDENTLAERANLLQ